MPFNKYWLSFWELGACGGDLDPLVKERYKGNYLMTWAASMCPVSCLSLSCQLPNFDVETY